MGASLTKNSYEAVAYSLPVTKTVPPNFKTSSYKCSGDDDCMNMDSYRSKPGLDPVFSCPAAKCSGGDCICGPDCVLDPYLGVCCQDLEVINNDVFCVEDRHSVLKIKNDDLTMNILDSDGNTWDFISSPNSALKKQITNSGVDPKKVKQALFNSKKQHLYNKNDNKSICNVPDQLVYNKNKTQYIIIPGSTVCSIYKNYTPGS